MNHMNKTAENISELLNLSNNEGYVCTNQLIDEHHFTLVLKQGSRKQPFIEKLQNIGAKSILSRSNTIFFRYGKPLHEEVVDVTKYMPDSLFMQSLKDYKKYSPNMSIDRIQDIDKLLMYYYGGRLLRWNSLCEKILKVIPDGFNSIIEQIDRRTDMKFNEIPTLRRGDRISFGMHSPNCSVVKEQGMYVYYVPDAAVNVQRAHKSNISVVERQDTVIWQSTRYKIQQGNTDDM